jgi:hypothetical protein
LYICPRYPVLENKTVQKKKVASKMQGCVSGSELDPDSIGSVDPDPYSESGSGSRRAKMTHKSRKNLEISCICNLDVFYRGIGIGKL